MLAFATYGGPAIYRLRASIVPDSYGDPVTSWDSPARDVLRGANAQPPTSTENETLTADQIHNERVLFVPGAADLTAEDRIEINSEVWRIDGDPVIRGGLALGVYTLARLRRGISKGG